MQRSLDGADPGWIQHLQSFIEICSLLAFIKWISILRTTTAWMPARPKNRELGAAEWEVESGKWKVGENLFRKWKAIRKCYRCMYTYI